MCRLKARVEPVWGPGTGFRNDSGMARTMSTKILDVYRREWPRVAAVQAMVLGGQRTSRLPAADAERLAAALEARDGSA